MEAAWLAAVGHSAEEGARLEASKATAGVAAAVWADAEAPGLVGGLEGVVGSKIGRSLGEGGVMSGQNWERAAKGSVEK